ncbi:MAG: hypothetical protein E6I85_00970 [Chloroflexi bacterium]|nr:MAG: hypothetical protein E6I85_00970 [Chloroflexota bacterium]
MFWAHRRGTAVIDYGPFRVREGSTDLAEFAGVFNDHDPGRLERWLVSVTDVVDVGAGAGAFSLLALEVAARAGTQVKVIAVEPDPDDLQFLGSQPFASSLKLLHTSTVTQGGEVPTLLRLNMDGGELELLQAGLPKHIRCLFLRWNHTGSPRDLLPNGFVKLIARDPSGATNWAWERS